MATKDYTPTEDGIELQFGVNHIGHFLLTNLLMEKMLAAKSGARIINISSLGYMTSGIRDDWNFKARTDLCAKSRLLTMTNRKSPTMPGVVTANPRLQIFYSLLHLHEG
jgi:NAD(P)-dependent dehydrogenase (short-subunit alcohol dehydrogenase family)